MTTQVHPAETARAKEGAAMLNSLLVPLELALRAGDDFPFLRVIREAVRRARDEIGKEEHNRMGGYWLIQGIIQSMDAVSATYPVEAYARLCHLAASVVNTNSHVWIVNQKEDSINIIADVVTAKADTLKGAA